MSESDKAETINAFKRANYFWVILAPLIGFIGNFIRTQRWRLMLRPLGYNPNYWNTFHCVMVMYFFNLFVPRLGEVTRCSFLAQYEKVPIEKSLGTMVTERLIDVLCLGVVFLLTLSCHPKKEFIHPIHKNITQSVYASGNVISRDQYQAFTIISGIVDHIYVSEGDSIKIGDKILTIANESQKLNIENARLSAAYANDKANEGKLSEAKMNISLAKSKMLNDSILLERQKQLWAQNIGSKIELEQRTLAYEASKTTYFSSKEKYIELGRTLKLSALQSKNNLSLASKLETDYTLKSMINGVIYSLNISEGEIATPQKPVATLGKINDFILEMQVDEYDIVQIKIGLPVMVVLNSHQDKVFEARV